MVCLMPQFIDFRRHILHITQVQYNKYGITDNRERGEKKRAERRFADISKPSTLHNMIHRLRVVAVGSIPGYKISSSSSSCISSLLTRNCRRSRSFVAAGAVTASSSTSHLLCSSHSRISRRRNISSSRPCHYQQQQQWSVASDTGIVSFEGKPRFQTVIGLEIHAQLDITTKLFSGCPVNSTTTATTTTTTNKNAHIENNNKPNTSVWPLDVAVPGVLPRLSGEAVRAAVLSAGAIKCRIPTVSRFERKHYFYADSPLGYQITQQRWPLARDGILTCRLSDNKKPKKKKKNKSKFSDDGDDDDTFTLRIERVQLEQDTGKTLADAYTNPVTGRKESLVDFNRAGRALIEIVSHPDLRSSTQAAIAVETLRSLLKHIGTCDGKMEEGSLRCDLNVSIMPILVDNEDEDDDTIINNDDENNNDIISRTGHRVEVKNLNSIRQVQLAAEYEALRQSKAILLDDSPTAQETRTFDVKGNRTVVIRTKGGAKDYRFMPEPDLPPLVLNEEAFALGSVGGKNKNVVEAFLEANLPELPDDARQRLQDDYRLSDYLAGVITSDPPAIAFFDESVHEAKLQLTNNVSDREERKIPETVANLLCNELFALVREFEMQRLIEEGLIDAGGGGGGSDSSIRFSRVTGSQLGEVVAILLEGTISNTMAKQLLRVLYSEVVEEEPEPTASSTSPIATTPLSPRKMARERGFQLITDAEELATLCRETIDKSPKEMERYKLGGKFSTKITKFLLGKTMGASRGNAHPERLNEVLAEILEDVAPLSEDD